MELTVNYAGGMQFEVKVRGHSIMVDQPKDSGGKDEGPTPPELFVASLGTCIGVYALWFCQKHKIPYEGTKINMTWSKSPTPPVRIDRIEVRLVLPQGCPEQYRTGLLSQVERCMVRNSITQAPEIKITI